MKFEHTKVWGFESALRGMRNPKNSWNKNDTIETDTFVTIGPNDMKLAKSLIKGGSEHRKFMRQIFVSVDITAPLYWWKEFDTYKVGTTANSTSTMHKLAETPITLENFEIDDCIYIDTKGDSLLNFEKTQVEGIIGFCEMLRKKYLETKDERVWKELIRWLPESWLQTRTVTMSYENLLSMYMQRENHKLSEWKISFCNWLLTLPYAELITYAAECRRENNILIALGKKFQELERAIAELGDSPLWEEIDCIIEKYFF